MRGAGIFDVAAGDSSIKQVALSSGSLDPRLRVGNASILMCFMGDGIGQSADGDCRMYDLSSFPHTLSNMA
jgi:hypothetical protein